MGNAITWVTQEEVVQQAELLLQNDDVTLASLSAYQVAKGLGRNANSTIYRYFDAWKAEKLRQDRHAVPLPEELLEPLEEAIQKFNLDFMATSASLLGSAMRTLDESANLKVIEARREVNEAKARAAEYLANWERDEARLAEIEKQLSSTRDQLAEQRALASMLQGRLAQIADDRKASRRPLGDNDGTTQADDVARLV